MFPFGLSVLTGLPLSICTINWPNCLYSLWSSFLCLNSWNEFTAWFYSL